MTVEPAAGGPRVGLMLPTAADTDADRLDPRRVLDAAARAEEAGFDGVYVGDHLVHPRPLLESVVTMTAVAARTSRLSVGTCVMLVALRDPLLLANQLATLARFAPGRLRLGAGVGGEYPAEFAAAGVPLAGRGRRMEQHLVELRRHLDAWDREDRPAVPAPPAPAPPILLGGHSETAIRRAARLGDGWVGYLLSTDSFARRAALLDRARAELGLGPSPLGAGMLLPVHLDDQDHRGAGRARAAQAWGKLTNTGSSIPDHLYLAGTPAEVVDALHGYWEAGCREIILAPADQGRAYTGQLDTLAGQILPELRAFSRPGEPPKVG